MNKVSERQHTSLSKWNRRNLCERYMAWLLHEPSQH